MSIIAAVVTKYAALDMTPTTKPPLYFDGIPQTDSAATKLVLPWVNLVDEGISVDESSEAGYDFEYNPIELPVFRFEVYAVQLAGVTPVMQGIKYGTGGIAGLLGFDFGTLTISGGTLMQCRRTREHINRAPQLQETGEYVHQGTIWYTVQAQVT